MATTSRLAHAIYVCSQALSGATIALRGHLLLVFTNLLLIAHQISAVREFDHYSITKAVLGRDHLSLNQFYQFYHLTLAAHPQLPIVSLKVSVR